MEQLIDVLRAIVNTVVILIVSKTLIGYHFPWEQCDCCKKKWADHKAEQTNWQSRMPQEHNDVGSNPTSATTLKEREKHAR